MADRYWPSRRLALAVRAVVLVVLVVALGISIAMEVWIAVAVLAVLALFNAFAVGILVVDLRKHPQPRSIWREGGGPPYQK